ncbi:hypothetical protein [Amycolatopsis regifaucium]|uniref:Uncharacterized protein n=1 Tax=Amycolatopsis regifaucium TaxID=546365 RepID=A0A154M6L1_9PSEU|nr:hypothetical protein [Amycolatopsis regifaucium]KZB80176.1 hypothetical protein AVL48_14265 [Amycolatopsis regifaucium]OKA09453.1 hypothetical protein ATP06_0208285 [Amycolatopsis regifaucium]SFH61900.1 hypothetical protein SAMN04489731_105271 [Amycolatopsis regifaucium]
MYTPSAHPFPVALTPGDPVREAAFQAATARLDEWFGDRVQVQVERFDRLGPWVFLQGTMRGTDNGRPYYAGTVYEARRADGVMSDVYVALLKKTDEPRPENDARAWRLANYAVGPTDVAWLTWPDEHEAPRALFGF